MAEPWKVSARYHETLSRDQDEVTTCDRAQERFREVLDDLQHRYPDAHEDLERLSDLAAMRDVLFEQLGARRQGAQILRLIHGDYSWADEIEGCETILRPIR